MKKGKLFSILASSAMVLSLCAMPVKVNAESSSIKLWKIEDGYGTIQDLNNGWYLLKGNDTPENMHTSTYASFSDLVGNADFTHGFSSSVSLDMSTMDSGETVAWSFGVTKNDKSYLTETTYHFIKDSDGVKLQNVQCNDTNGLVVKELDSPITSNTGIVDLMTKFTNDGGKLKFSYYVDNKNIVDYTTQYNYSDVLGPRYGWLFQNCTEEGIKATLPSINGLGLDKEVQTEGGYGSAIKLKDGTYRLFGGSDPETINMMYGPVVRPKLKDSDISNGFKVSAKLSLKEMTTNSPVAWSFGVTGKDDKYLDEAAFHFGMKDGKPALINVESNKSGLQNNVTKLENAVTTDNDEFKLTAAFTPSEKGNLIITYYVDDVKVAETETTHQYDNVKAPRYGWAFECKPEKGIVLLENATAETIAVEKGKITTEIPGEINPNQPVKDVTVGVDANKETETILTESAPKEIKDKIDEKLNVGQDVITEVVVEKVDKTKVAKDEVAKIENVIGTTGKVAQYLDLSIVVKSGDEILGNITETTKELTFQIAVPKELAKEGRVFKVVRVHDGEAEELKTTEENGVLTFKTDKFSTYALAYVDAITTDPTDPTVPPKEDPKPTPKPEVKPDDTVKTSDETNVALYATFAGLALVGAAIVVTMKKKEDLLNK